MALEQTPEDRRSKAAAPDRTDVAWSAGFLDGEGAFQVRSRNQGRCKTAFVVSANQVVIEPLAKLQRLWGGYISSSGRQRGNHRPIHEWHVSGAEAATMVRAIRPFLCVKAAQADLMLTYAALPGAFRKGTPAGRGLSDEEIVQRRAITAAASVLNQRGLQGARTNA